VSRLSKGGAREEVECPQRGGGYVAQAKGPEMNSWRKKREEREKGPHAPAKCPMIRKKESGPVSGGIDLLRYPEVTSEEGGYKKD